MLKRKCDICDKELEGSVYYYNEYNKRHDEYPVCFECFNQNLLKLRAN